MPEPPYTLRTRGMSIDGHLGSAAPGRLGDAMLLR